MLTEADVLEKQVQEQIETLLDDLIKKGKPIYYWRSNAGKVFTIGHPKPFIEKILEMFKCMRSFSEIMAFAWKNIRAVILAPLGHPDYTACINGKFVGIECKRMIGGKQKPEQKEIQTKIEACGGVYLLCNTAAPLRLFLKEEGLL